MYLTIIFKFELFSFVLYIYKDHLYIYKDHIGGLIGVLQEFPVKEVIDLGVVHTTKTFEDYLTLLIRKISSSLKAGPE